MLPSKIPYPFLIIAGCCALMTTSISIPLSCASLFYPSVCEALGVGTGPLSIYMTIQNLVMAGCLPIASKILTSRDVRWVLSGAVILYAASFAAMSLYTSLSMFYVSGVLLGIAGSFLVYLSVPLLVNNWFKARAGTAMGVAYAFIGLGAAIFSPLTGLVITHFGWRTAYVFLGVMMAALSLPFTLFVIRGKPSELGMKAYGEDALPVGSVAADNGGLTRKEAFRTSQFYMVFVFTGLLGINAAFMYHIPSFIQGLHFSAAQASTIMAVGMLGTTLGKLSLGYLIDKIGIMLAGTLGLLVGVVGSLILFIWGHVGVGPLMLGTLFFGVAYACTVLEPPHVVKSVFGNKEYSAIYSVIMVFSAVGTALGMTFFGFMRDASGSYASSISLSILMMVLAMILLVVSLQTGVRLLRSAEVLK